MVILHPAFTFLFVILVVFSFLEVYDVKKKKSTLAIWLIGILMVLLIGLRGNVGADYPIYRSMYLFYFPTVEYSEIFNKMLLRHSVHEIEWLYMTLNKIIFYFAVPFQIFTLVSACLTVGLKLRVYQRNSIYPIFSVLLFLIPAYFIADSGHMRQALGMTMCLVSFVFIKERKVWLYLLCIYLAFGFHKSTIVFLPVYWLVLVPLNSIRIFYLIIISVILSPFQVYHQFSGILSSLSVQDVSNGYIGYIGYEEKASSFMDGIVVVYAVLLVLYDKKASEKIWYYEYMRNILVMGVCLYFIFRDNPVFSTRLVGSFIGFSAIVIPNIIASLDVNMKRLWHLFFVLFMIFYYFVFARYQGVAGRFTADTYRNFLWSK